jgi:hypothetical protein
MLDLDSETQIWTQKHGIFITYKSNLNEFWGFSFYHGISVGSHCWFNQAVYAIQNRVKKFCCTCKDSVGPLLGGSGPATLCTSLFHYLSNTSPTAEEKCQCINLSIPNIVVQ